MDPPVGKSMTCDWVWASWRVCLREDALQDLRLHLSPSSSVPDPTKTGPKHKQVPCMFLSRYGLLKDNFFPCVNTEQLSLASKLHICLFSLKGHSPINLATCQHAVAFAAVSSWEATVSQTLYFYRIIVFSTGATGTWSCLEMVT